MLRLGLSARILGIGVTFLLTAWIALIALYYWSNGLSRISTYPSATQILTVADVLSDAGPQARGKLAAAVSSSVLTVEIKPPGDASLEPATREHMQDLPEFADYEAALGERLISIRRLDPAENGVRRPRLLAGAIDPIEFRIRLSDGAIARLETRTPFIVTLFGLPAGMGAGLVGTLFAFAAFILLHREIRPLTKLAAAVDRMDPSGEPVELPRISARTPETVALVKAFERLQGRLQSMISSRFALISGVQHDVRSFATRLRLRIDHISDQTEREKAVRDIADMIDLLDNALLTARAGVGALDEELLDLVTLVRQEIVDLETSGWNVTLSSVPQDREMLVIADRLALRRIIANLVDNAVKYGQIANVALNERDNMAIISVEDKGPGIAEGEIGLLLEPFVRSEPSRARKTGGAGLGLAVVRNLVEAQGGTIVIGNRSEGGARIELRFPLFEPQKG
ncbi:histidine kinase (plasmid) [Rhizobium ruizarguesonis]|uniref:sensor histidine kinase n=1 Tax=Rhizobium ruizarguesonis TaxID=2081791 RepID=UPI001030E125|nr:ATP-binding protein [Rhizobium ruizarguesonis]TBB62047.1 histidine kinase [Rhizobium ruizarguesonis]TBC26136.1 histidine kinase [Rhizobium ruizarguesonis]